MSYGNNIAHSVRIEAFIFTLKSHKIILANVHSVLTMIYIDKNYKYKHMESELLHFYSTGDRM